MSSWVQVAAAGDVTEAEEIESILSQAGIESRIESAVAHDPEGTDDVPQRVLVAESDLEAAQNAIEALTEPDDPIAD
jgi:hypothetical protein